MVEPMVQGGPTGWGKGQVCEQRLGRNHEYIYAVWHQQGTFLAALDIGAVIISPQVLQQNNMIKTCTIRKMVTMWPCVDHVTEVRQYIHNMAKISRHVGKPRHRWPTCTCTHESLLISRPRMREVIIITWCLIWQINWQIVLNKCHLPEQGPCQKKAECVTSLLVTSVPWTHF